MAPVGDVQGPATHDGDGRKLRSDSWAAQTEALLLSIPATAAALGIGRATVYELFARGDLKRVKVGRRALVRRTDIERYVAALGGD